MQRIIVCFVCAFLLLNRSAAQKLPVKVSFFNEATAIPFSRFLTRPVHPGIQVGTELRYKERKRVYLYQTVNLGYTFHQYLYQGLFVNTDIGVDLSLGLGLRFKALLGAGYLRSFATQKQYRFEEGRYTPERNSGNGRLTFSLGTGVGYRLHRKTPYAPEIFLLYQGVAEYPYAPGFIPVMTHTRLHAGAKFFLNSRTK